MVYAVSACLLGTNCKYSGDNNYNEELCKRLKGHEVIEVCPEVMGGLPVPRVPVELVDGIAINKEGQNVNEEFVEGAKKCLSLLEDKDIECVILQPRSPSCGVGKIYDGTFSKRLIPGNGVFAKALIEKGYRVQTVDEFLSED